MFSEKIGLLHLNTGTFNHATSQIQSQNCTKSVMTLTCPDAGANCTILKLFWPNTHSFLTSQSAYDSVNKGQMLSHRRKHKLKWHQCTNTVTNNKHMRVWHVQVPTLSKSQPPLLETICTFIYLIDNIFHWHQICHSKIILYTEN